jgi:acetyltransferase-like isoleucine patch superfamily enzyme
MLSAIIRLLKHNLESLLMSGYNEYTIEDYFRKKGYRIGKNNRIYIRALSTEPYLVKIGNHCTITAGVIFLTHDGGAWVFRDEIPELNVFGKIEVKDNCFIGINSIIMPNVIIGQNSVVGAGSVVTKDVPPNTVVAGVPAKEICTLEEYKQKCIKKWESLNLRGKRNTWENQLIEHFWPEERK